MVSPSLHRLLVEATVNERERAAAVRALRHPHESIQSPSLEAPVTLRLAVPADAEAVARLAALDSAEPPVHPILLGEVGGRLGAALSLSDGAVIADPFHATAALVELLQARARQLHGGHRRAFGWPRLRARLGLIAWR